MTKNEDLKAWDKELGERLDDLMRVCKEYGATAYHPMPQERRLCLESDLELQMRIIKSGILDRYTRPTVTPTDTVTVSREVLQGVRENLELIANVYTNDRHIPADTEAANALHGSLSHCDDLARQALTSLDAVLSEGE